MLWSDPRCFSIDIIDVSENQNFDEFPQIDLEESASHSSPPPRRGAPSNHFSWFFQWSKSRFSACTGSIETPARFDQNHQKS